MLFAFCICSQMHSAPIKKGEAESFWTIVMPNEKSKCLAIVPRHLATGALKQKAGANGERANGEREREGVRASDTVNLNVCPPSPFPVSRSLRTLATLAGTTENSALC